MLIRRAAKDTVPVVILAGFLGAGKTTILNYVLQTSVGAKIAVVVNDFGSVNIDSMLIADQSARKLELTNGCICCSMDGGELEEALTSALASEPDAIIVEASGLAEPEDLARMVILSSNPKIGYGGLVYVVDAVNYEATVQKHKRVRQHIELADLIVITKVEHVGKAGVAAVMSGVKKETPALIVPVERGELAPELLFDVPVREEVQPSLLQQDDTAARRHVHDVYNSVTFETEHPLDPVKWKTLMNQRLEGVYRIKGFIYFGLAGYEQKFVLQSVGHRWDMYAEAWREGEKPRTTLVLIGVGLDEESLISKLQGSVGESNEMIDIRRYTTN